MKIGLMSDTHGSVARTARAARRLVREGAEQICHCGDIGSEAVLIELAGICGPPGIPVWAVLGNVDGGSETLAHFPENTGIRVRPAVAEVVLGEQVAAVLHGHDTRLLRETLQSGRFAYVFTGHTHEADDRRVGSTRVINPGAVYRSAQPTVALLDTVRDQVEWIAF